LWTRRLDDHLYARITGSPTLYRDRLYVPVSSMEETAASQQGYECCTFRGSLNALDIKTGAILWKTFTVPPASAAGKNAAGVALFGPSGVGIWSAPTIDAKRGLVYAGTGNTYSAPAQPTADAIVAFDLKSGAIKWIHQLTADDIFGCRAGSANCGEKAGPDFDLGTPPMLITLADGRDVIVAAQNQATPSRSIPTKRARRSGSITPARDRSGAGFSGARRWTASAPTFRSPTSARRSRRAARGRPHHRRARVVRAAPPLKCATGTGCSAALISRRR